MMGMRVMMGLTTSSAAAMTPWTSTPVLDAEAFEGGGEDLGGGVAGPGAEGQQRPVDLFGPGAGGVDGVRDAEADVLVAVEPDLGVGAELGNQGGDAVGDVLEDQGAGGVHDVDALAAGVGHDPGLLGQLFRGGRGGRA